MVKDQIALMYTYSSLYVHKIRVSINIPRLQRDWKTEVLRPASALPELILISPGSVHRTLSRSVCTLFKLLFGKVVSRLFVMGIYVTKFWFQISTSLRVVIMFYVSVSQSTDCRQSTYMHGFYWRNSLFVFLNSDLKLSCEEWRKYF